MEALSCKQGHLHTAAEVLHRLIVTVAILTQLAVSLCKTDLENRDVRA